MNYFCGKIPPAEAGGIFLRLRTVFRLFLSLGYGEYFERHRVLGGDVNSPIGSPP